MIVQGSIEALAARLPQAWSLASSSKWTPDNPAAGQCGVTALLVHERFGGDILKTRIGDAWHFYNRIAWRRLDLTASQFRGEIAYDDAPSNVAEAMAETSPAQISALRARLSEGAAA